MDRPLPQLSLKERREVTVAALCEHFAADRLEMAEFEARLDVAHRARTPDELASLLSDLPSLDRPAAAPTTAARAVELLNEGGRALGEAVRESRTLVAFMSGIERRGHWAPARRNVVVAIMGGAELDFREVELPPGETEVFLFCLMGGAEIIVPPDLVVESNGIAIMGGFEHGSSGRRPRADAPVLRLNGVCITCGVEITVRLPGETAGDAKRRLREEKQARRLRPPPADSE
jgi:hypothetical protein